MAIRLGGALKEIRIHLCQTSKPSAGVRDFIEQNYVKLKQDNPGFPILIRECNGIQPRLWARYDKGCEKMFPLDDLGCEQVKGIICNLEKGVERTTALTNLSAGDVLSALKQLLK